jgi:hypothetical protein
LLPARAKLPRLDASARHPADSSAAVSGRLLPSASTHATAAAAISAAGDDGSAEAGAADPAAAAQAIAAIANGLICMSVPPVRRSVQCSRPGASAGWPRRPPLVRLPRRRYSPPS